MRKREISNDEMNIIIKMAEHDDSWLKIERVTGIPRAAAKRAYDRWEQNRSLAELRKVRFNIAGERAASRVDGARRAGHQLDDTWR